MKQIDIISELPKQTMSLVLDSGFQFELQMRFVDNQRGWFYNIVSDPFTVYNRRLVTFPNLLRAFRNIIPFGLACTTDGNREPMFLTDFSNGISKLYVLEPVDVDFVETMVERDD